MRDTGVLGWTNQLTVFWYAMGMYFPAEGHLMKNCLLVGLIPAFFIFLVASSLKPLSPGRVSQS